LPKQREAKSKALLLEAGVRLFTAVGGKSPTIREVAAEAGVNHALISYHFGGMAGLMDAVIDHCIQELRAMFIQEQERFLAQVRGSDAPALPGIMRGYALNLLTILSGPKGAALLRALSSPEAFAVRDVYGRFSENILVPLHHSFAVLVARARGSAEDALETVVLAQCMLAQGMAFFRGGWPVLRSLGKAAFTDDEVRRISEIVAEALCRTAGLA
jgi:AcrR family transcriptional regulator